MMISLLLGGVGADLILVEGTGALYDSPDPTSLRGSDAEIAALAQIPTVALLDGRGCGGTAAVILKGLAAATQGFDLVGGIINRVAPHRQGDEPDRAFYEKSAAHWTSKPIFGVVPELQLTDEPPPKGLSQRKNYTSLSRQFFVDIGKAIQQHVNLDGLLVCAADAEILQVSEFRNDPMMRRTRIGVADDVCFSIGFQENIELLRYFGAEVVPFSPLSDDHLPKRLGAIYLPGAFLTEYGKDLGGNRAMKSSIHDFYSSGGVVYSEGSATAYLSRDFTLPDGTTVPGVGILPCSVQQGRGAITYGQGVTTEESVLGRSGQVMRGLLLDEWKLSREERMTKLLRISKTGGSPVAEGFSPGAQVLATFGLFHFGANPEVARSLVDAAEVVAPLNG
jgi:cobyrinic acid a,c-diamide synthase